MKTPLFLLSLFALMRCNNSSENPSDLPEPVPTEEPEDLSYLALGDSYTIGESVEPSLRWPVQLVEELRDRGVPIDYPRIIARTGWTTQDLLNAMDEQLNEEKYDLVSVLIGVNNQYQGKSIEAYEEDLREIFQRAISHSKRGKEGVFAVSIPDYGATPFGASNSEEIAQEIKAFNEVFKKVASEYGIDFYDITPISKQAREDESLVATDGLHPSGKMYTLWVEEILDRVVERIPSEN